MSLGTLGIVIVAVAALFTGAGLLVLSRDFPPATIDAWIEAARPWLFLWRLGLFGALIGFWPAFCQWLARAQDLTTDQHERLLAARWHVATWLVILELLLGQNVVGEFINLVVSRL